MEIDYTLDLGLLFIPKKIHGFCGISEKKRDTCQKQQLNCSCNATELINFLAEYITYDFKRGTF